MQWWIATEGRKEEEKDGGYVRFLSASHRIRPKGGGQAAWESQMTMVSPRLSGCPGRTGGDTPYPVASHSKRHLSHTHLVCLARKNDRHTRSSFKNDNSDCKRWYVFTLLPVETVSKKM